MLFNIPMRRFDCRNRCSSWFFDNDTDSCQWWNTMEDIIRESENRQQNGNCSGCRRRCSGCFSDNDFSSCPFWNAMNDFVRERENCQTRENRCGCRRRCCNNFNTNIFIFVDEDENEEI